MIFYVDQPLTIKENTIYPDITIVDNKIIKNFVDIKMDLGWNRDGFISFCEAKQNLVKQIQNKEVRIRDGITKNGTILQIHAKIKYHIVIISDQNIPKAKFDSNRVGVKKLKDVEVYVLSGNKHPNTYQKHIEELLNSINIHENEFTRLFKNISK